MAVGEGSGTTVQLEETTESVKLLINESWCALAGDKGIQKGFLPCTFLEPEECNELQRGGEDWGSGATDMLCSSEGMSRRNKDDSWPGKERVLDFTSSKETVGVSLPPVMKQYVQSVVDSRWEQWRSEGRLSLGEETGGISLKTKYDFLLCKAEVHLCRLITTHLSIVGKKRARWATYPRGSTHHRIIPTLDQVLQEMEKAEGVPKKIKRRKRKLSTYMHVRKKKKKTGRAVVAQQTVEGEETNPQNEEVEEEGEEEEEEKGEEEEEEEEELPTLSATGAQSGGSQLSLAACEDSSTSSVSSEEVDTLMMV